MMKDTKTEKDKLHRYLDDLYTRDDASQLLQSIKDSENQDILDELAAEVWEESGNLQPGNDLEREKYKREARQLLKRIEHKKRTWFRRASVVAVSTAAVIAIIIGSVNFFRYMNEQQVTLAEITTSSPSFTQIAPAMLSEEEFSLAGITITFNSGTTISVKRATPGGVIKMLRDYERKEGDPCIL